MFSIEPRVESAQKESTLMGSEPIKKISFDMAVILPLPTCQGLFEFHHRYLLWKETQTNSSHAQQVIYANTGRKQLSVKLFTEKETDYPSNSLCSVITGPVSLPVEAGIRASWCHSESEAAAVVEAQTCSSALHLQSVAGGEEIWTVKVSPTNTHTHTFTLLKVLGFKRI